MTNRTKVAYGLATLGLIVGLFIASTGFAAKNLTAKNMDSELGSEMGKVVIIYTIPNCGYCKLLKNDIKAIEAKNKDVKFYFIDASKEGEITPSNIPGFPAYIYGNKGVVIGNGVGYEKTLFQKQLDEVFKK